MRSAMPPYLIFLMLLQTVSVESFKSKAEVKAESRKKRLWFDGKISVCYGPEIAGSNLENNLEVAINAINRSTCLQFKVLPNRHNTKDCLQVRLLPRKFSTYAQWNFFTDCTDGPPPTVPVLASDQPDDLVRRLLNAVAGLQYEHQREDRDEHVEVFYENILPEYRSEFEVVAGYPPNVSTFPKYSHGDIMSAPLNYRTKSTSTSASTLRFSYMPKLRKMVHNYFSNKYLGHTGDFRKVDALYSELEWQSCGVFSAFWCDKRGPEKCHKEYSTTTYQLLRSYKNSLPPL